MADQIRFEWDEHNLAHIARHGVARGEAEQALINEPLDRNFEIVEGESRWESLGHTNNLRVLRLFWTVRRNGMVRVVTAFDASRAEAREYWRARIGQ